MSKNPEYTWTAKNFLDDVDYQESEQKPLNNF